MPLTLSSPGSHLCGIFVCLIISKCIGGIKYARRQRQIYSSYYLNFGKTLNTWRLPRLFGKSRKIRARRSGSPI